MCSQGREDMVVRVTLAVPLDFQVFRGLGFGFSSRGHGGACLMGSWCLTLEILKSLSAPGVCMR